MNGFHKEAELLKEALVMGALRGIGKGLGHVAAFPFKHPLITGGVAAGAAGMHTLNSANKAFQQKRVMGPQSYGGGVQV